MTTYFVRGLVGQKSFCHHISVKSQQWRTEAKWRPWQPQLLRPPPPHTHKKKITIKFYVYCGEAARNFFNRFGNYYRGCRMSFKGAFLLNIFFSFPFSLIFAPPWKLRPWQMPSLPPPIYATESQLLLTIQNFPNKYLLKNSSLNIPKYQASVKYLP